MRVAHLTYTEALARRRASQIASGLLLFLLTTAAGLATPNAPYQLSEAGVATDTKGPAPAPNSADSKPSVTVSGAQAPGPLFNIDSRLTAEVEPNGVFGSATPLTLNASGLGKITGNVFGNGDVDFYSFTAAAGDRVYAATMTSASASGSTDSQLRLYATDGSTLIETDLNDGTFGASSSSIAGASIPSAGTYFLEVRGGTATAQIRPYDLHVQLRSGAPVAEVEPNDTTVTATPLPASGWVSGARGTTTDADFYSFTANAGDTIFLSLDGDPERDNVQWNPRVGLGLFGDADNQILVANDASVGSATNPLSEAMFLTVKNTGTYVAYVDTAVVGVGGPTFTYQLSVSVLPALNAFAGGSCTTYTSTNVPVVISDAAPSISTSTLTIPGNPRIADLDVSIQLNHTFMQDLDVSLISPGGNVVGMFTDIGNAAVGGQAQMDLVFDDEAAIPPAFTIVRGLRLRPELNFSLGWFDGQDAGGTWTLDLRDDATGDGGNLTGWSMTVCEAPPPPVCPVGFAEQTVFTTDFETGAAGFISSGTANEWEVGTPSFAPITTCNSGTGCFATDLDNTYDVSSNQTLLSPAINLAGLSAPVVVRWAQKYQMESASFDLFNVTAQQVGGATPARLFEWLGATMTNAVGNPTVTLQESAGWGQFTARADALAGQNMELAFNLTSDTTVNFAGAAIDDVSVTACRAVTADLAITKTDGVTTATPGGSVTYTITASNTGPDPVPNATVADTFPAPLTCTWTCVGAGTGTCTAAGSGNINDTVNLPAGGSTTYTASCAVAASATGTLTNTATVASSVTDPTPGNNSATDTDSLDASANLGATLTDTPDPVTAGGNLTYTATATNAGPSDAQTVTAALPLPAGTTYVSATPSAGGVCTNPGVGSNGTVNCTWAGATTTAAPRSVSVVAAVGIATAGPLSATLTVGSATTDPAPGNNTATATTAVAAASADVAVTLMDTPDPVAAGGTLGYTASLTNNGPAIAQDIAVSLPLPANTTFLSATPSAGGTCMAPVVGSGGSISCTWAGATASGAARVLTASVMVANSAVGALTATATGSSSSVDTVPANNTATATTAVAAGADLALTLTASPNPATTGAAITYVATAINNGPSDASNVQIDVVLGASVLFSSATPSMGGVCTSPSVGSTGTVSCTWAGVTANGSSRSVNVIAYRESIGTAAATATASSATNDPTPANNAATGNVTVGNGAATTTATVIPTVDRGVLALLALMFGLFGFAAMRRRM